MTEHDIFSRAASFETQSYGPLYIVSGSHARGRTFHAFLLDPGQELAPNPRSGPNNRHPDLRNDQEIYGVVRGQPGWTEEYGWIEAHQGVQDGTAKQLFTQLVDANEQAKNLGMTSYRERSQWLDVWARQNLGVNPLAVSLPDLDDPSSAPGI